MLHYNLLRRVKLGPQHRPTGRTRHYRAGELIPVPAELHIVKVPGDPGYYLLYLDGHGNELTDTYHDTVGRAMDQAEWEFGVRPEEWEELGQ